MTNEKNKKVIPPRIQEDEYEQDRGSLTAEQDAIAEKAKAERFGRFSRWPAFIKSSLIKLWVAGACCFFIIWGGFKVNQDVLDSAALMALAVGILTDFIVNPVLDMTDGPKRDINKFIMVNLKIKNKGLRYSLSPILNFLYAFVIAVSIMYFYHGINQLAIMWQWRKNGEIFLAVEPILYGVIFVLFDFILLSIRNLIIFLIKKVNANKNQL